MRGDHEEKFERIRGGNTADTATAVTFNTL